jgi:hypothetical protein
LAYRSGDGGSLVDVSPTEVFLSDANRRTAQSSSAPGLTLSLAGLAITKNQASPWQKPCFAVLAAPLMGYAFLTGLHTLNQDDLFWMLATARWIVQNRDIPGRIISLTRRKGSHGYIPWVAVCCFMGCG